MKKIQTSEPLVSIIMPVYNVEEYIEEALDSLVNQKYKYFQLIAVNDGSTDESFEILKKYEKDKIFANFIIISQENHGLSEARNSGVKLAKGKYVYFMDSDDCISPETIEKCVEFAEKADLDIVHFGAELFATFGDHDDSAYYETHLTHAKVYTKYEFIKDSMEHLRVPVWLYFYKSELLKQSNQFYPYIVHEDELFTPQILIKSRKIGVLNDKFFKRRLRPNSIVTNKSAESLKRKENSYCTILNELAKLRINQHKDIVDFINSREIRIANDLISIAGYKKYMLLTMKKVIPLAILPLKIRDKIQNLKKR